MSDTHRAVDVWKRQVRDNRSAIRFLAEHGRVSVYAPPRLMLDEYPGDAPAPNADIITFHARRVRHIETGQRALQVTHGDILVDMIYL
jgi:hypothetical protein